MAWYNTIANYFSNIFYGRSKMDAATVPQAERQALIEMPIQGGNINGAVIGTVSPTNIDAQLGFDGIFLQRPMPDKDYDYIYHLGRYNNDVSFAEDNVVQLAGSSLKITLDPSVGARQSAQMIARCKERLETWYAGGSIALINALFRQVYLFGGVSGEAQPVANLTGGVGRVVLMSHKYLYFGWDKLRGAYHPYQSGTLTMQGQATSLYNKLNLLTYKYIPYKQWREDIPYAVSPILSAMQAACIEQSMIENLNAVVKRMGLLGFLEVVVNAPEKKKAGENNNKIETDAQYQARIQAYLRALEPGVEKGLSNGYVISAKQMVNGKESKPEFNMTQSTANSASMVGLAELVVTMKCAGLKQDGALLGKNFSTTETLISTLLRKFSHQLMNYQEIVCQFFEHCFALDLRLAGYQFKSVDVKMDAPTLMDTDLEYSGKLKQLEYYGKLYADGLIDKVTYAQSMGYEKPAIDGTPAAAIPLPTEKPKTNPIV